MIDLYKIAAKYFAKAMSCYYDHIRCDKNEFVKCHSKMFMFIYVHTSTNGQDKFILNQLSISIPPETSRKLITSLLISVGIEM